MADVAIGVRGYLLAQSVVTDLIGQRLYTDQLPQSATMPAVVMTKLFTVHEHQLSDLAGLAKARLQFECYAGGPVDGTHGRNVANEIAEAIRTSGIVTQKGVTNGVDIRGVKVEEGMSYKTDADTEGGDEQRYVSTIDLEVAFTET